MRFEGAFTSLLNHPNFPPPNVTFAFISPERSDRGEPAEIERAKFLCDSTFEDPLSECIHLTVGSFRLLRVLT